MVNAGDRFKLVGLLALAIAAGASAADFTRWQIGDVADRDVSAPMALDVIDAQATAARRAQEAQKVPAIFRGYTSVTNTMVVKVTAAFAGSRSNFLAGLQQAFQQPTLDEAAVRTPAFEEFVAAFNEKNKKLPITAELARQWAQGISTAQAEADYVQQLLRITRRPVTPDELPAGFEPGKNIRLVSVRVSKEPLTLEQADRRGKLVAQTNIIAITQLRTLFRRDFPAGDQAFARALATYIHPNCDVDTNLTAAARERATGQIVVAYHYDAGQVIARRGHTVDARIQATLRRLAETTAAAQLAPPNVAAKTEAVPTLPSAASGATSNASDRQLWLWLGVPAILIVIAGGVVLVLKRSSRRPATLLPVQVNQSVTGQATLPPELAPQLVQILKTAVVQELAAQRQELLQTQHTAAAEVVRLMHRLNELHAPLQERLTAYERRIQELEAELSVRTEENRELLKLKIDLLRQQLEAERVVSPRTGFN